MADTVGMQDLRAENITKVVTGFALQEYVMKQLCLVQSSSSWKESYWKETKGDLSGAGTRTVEGISRLAEFPTGEVSWTEASSRLKKYGMEGDISWEDSATNDVDVIARSLLRIARAVTKAVDDEIWDVISEGRYASTINSLTISAGDEWDSATIQNRDPIQDILNAKKEIYKDNYNPDANGYLLLNPTDYANLMGNANVRNAGQFYTDEVTRNGKVGFLLGLKVLVSNSVTDNYAMVVIGNEAATWKEAKALTTKVIEDFGIKYTIRAWEVGTCQLKNPEAVCLIVNTQA